MYRIDIKSDEVAQLLGVTLSTARRHLRTLRHSLEKNKNQIITIAEFCKHYDISYKEVFCQVNKLKSQEYDNLVEEGVIVVPVIKYRTVKKW